MNELQKVELDILQQFIDACEKLNVQYFLVCGSALGAKRHGGFIPWDDDMDVGMYREDYNKFMEQAPAILPEGYFLQNYKTDPAYPNAFAKLRNSNTTYIEKSAMDLKMNHGVYIDIFPLDGYPQEPKHRKKMAIKKKYYSILLSCVFKGNRTWRSRLAMWGCKALGCHKRTAKIVAKYEELISQYPVKDAKLICNHGTWYGDRDYIAAEFYGKGSDGVFEGLKVRLPEQCEQYLQALYGDWQQLPPPEKQVGHHYYQVCDTQKPYTEYL